MLIRLVLNAGYSEYMNLGFIMKLVRLTGDGDKYCLQQILRDQFNELALAQETAEYDSHFS